MNQLQGLLFWGFLLVFGAVMYLVSPRSKDEAGFFRGLIELAWNIRFA